MRVGIIGCGRVADSLHFPALRRIPGVNVTALCDLDAGRLTECGRRHGVSQLHSVPEKLAADGTVDVILLAAPTAAHHAAMLEVAGFGKPVYLEKPVARTMEEAREIAVLEAKVRVGMGFNLRSHRLVDRARSVVQSGALGRIVGIRSLLIGGDANRPLWQTRFEDGGGPLHELGVHHFDLWRFLLGEEVTDPRASGDIDSTVSVTARFESGAAASAMFALNGTPANEIEIIGERFRLRFSLYQGDSFATEPAGRARAMLAWVKELPDAARSARFGGDFIDSYRRHWLRFFESVRSGNPMPATVDDGIHALRVVLDAAR
ncbi:MAG: Gfo/Idh/MocA family oxidoreductase [Acidobacteria bacterium]|nr:Gfo/Idh/MocA family oxidoreductase [Alphaproteobacteria bacterium]MBM3768342.1 Gfo/Idh/MocA family oxidoreductase [Acidobacteriota bacterium]